jgi:predicted nucleic acid-binding protein
MRGLTGAPRPFLEADAELAAEMFNAAGRLRGSLPDCQIAAVAVRAGARLATLDQGVFGRLAGLGLILAP